MCYYYLWPLTNLGAMHALGPTWTHSFSSFCLRYCRLLDRNVTSKRTGRSSFSPHNRCYKIIWRTSVQSFPCQVTPGLGKYIKHIFLKFLFTVSRVNEARATLTATQSPSNNGRGAYWYIHPENWSLRNMSTYPS